MFAGKGTCNGKSIGWKRAGDKHLKVFATLIFLLSPFIINGQHALKINSFGSDIGGTLLTPSPFSNPVSSQYRFFLRHNISQKAAGEFNVGVGFLSRPLQQSRLFPMEYRVLYSLRAFEGNRSWGSGNRFNPYLYAGLGAAHHQRLNVEVQVDPLLRESDREISNTSIWNNGSGWVLQIPLGVGADYRLDSITALKVTAGYHLLAGRSFAGSNSKLSGFLGATIGLSFRPFGNSKKIPGSSRIQTIRTLPRMYSKPEKSNPWVTTELPNAYDLHAYRSFQSIQYETLQYQLKKADEKTIRETVELLQSDGALKVKVMGHTSKSGNYIMNRSLSNARSWYITRYLLEQGIGYSRIYQNGYGEERPVVSGNTPAAHAVNRRTEIQLGYRFPAQETSGFYGVLPEINDESGNKYLIPPSAIAFEPYSDELSVDARRWLWSLSQLLLEREEYIVRISAGGDRYGSEQLNRMLREARIASVMRFLLSNGVSFEQLRNDVESESDHRYGNILIKKQKSSK